MTGNNVPFSQRVGLTLPPPQLQLGQVSAELRRLLEYALALEMERVTSPGVGHVYFRGQWALVSKELHVRYFQRSIRNYDPEPRATRRALEREFGNAKYGALFDLIEFLIQQPGCSNEFKEDLAAAFETAHAAYRIIEQQVVAIGTEQQAAAFETAICETDQQGTVSARQHLIAAGNALRNEDWAGSIRESITAVESVARLLAPGTRAVSPALAAIERNGHIHGGLKAAFSSLYGYTSDQEGIRHALVFEDKPNVDEADALFMLGACASFVSYLLARVPQTAVINE